jgi:hypothetical protein
LVNPGEAYRLGSANRLTRWFVPGPLPDSRTRFKSRSSVAMTLDHLSFGTHDLASTRHFYEGQLGFGVISMSSC